MYVCVYIYIILYYIIYFSPHGSNSCGALIPVKVAHNILEAGFHDFDWENWFLPRQLLQFFFCTWPGNELQPGPCNWDFFFISWVYIDNYWHHSPKFTPLFLFFFFLFLLLIIVLLLHPGLQKLQIKFFFLGGQNRYYEKNL